MKKLRYLILFSGLFPLTASAQAPRTGSYDTTIAFMGGSRAVSAHVPAGYNPANKYRLMIGLHGMGDTCSAYRDGLINSLGWGAGIPNTIFIFPEAAGRSADFHQPAGSERIIDEAMHFMMEQYHIDTANVVLQGFSLGGRAALRYGLNNPGVFRGLMLNTPALQGVKEALNLQPTYPFSYGRAAQVPMYVTHGADDIAYSAPIDSMMEQLIMNDGPAMLYRQTGVGHSVPSAARIATGLAFLEAPGTPGKDAELIRVIAPEHSCTSTLNPELLFRNTGTETITSGTVEVRTRGVVTSTYSIVGTLAPFEHAIIPLPPQTLTAGTNAVSVQATLINGTPVPAGTASSASAEVQYAAQGRALPLTEDFEATVFPPTGWTIQQSGDFYTPWISDEYVKRSGDRSANAFNCIFYFDNSGRKEGLTSPAIDLRSAPRPQLSFDIAYNYHRYTPPYFAQQTDFADTLEVLISTDCGDHFTPLFRKGGADLSTFSSPIMNPLDIASCYADPSDSEWRRINIDLSSQAGAANALVRFNYISALGGSINIDNVSVASTPTSVGKTAAPSWSVHPNPATDELTVNPAGEAIERVSILDATGRTVLQLPRNAGDMQAFRLDLRNMPAGLYTLQLHTTDGIRTAKLAVRK